MNRELPVLRDLFGPPGEHGLLDAGCGPGRHLIELAGIGYEMTGLDMSPAMLQLARENLAASGCHARLVEASLEKIPTDLGPLDGIYCLGNSLAATGSRAKAQSSVEAMAKVLRPGGRIFVQILNFAKVRINEPYVLGPRICVHDGKEFVSSRVFFAGDDDVQVTSVTVWKQDGAWRQAAGAARIYPVSRDDIDRWFNSYGLHVIALYGGYDKMPFDTTESQDLIVVAEKSGKV